MTTVNCVREETATIALLVENNAGVLARVALLFGRRGYNIDSLTVSETGAPGISRITVTTRGDQRTIQQIMLQTRKLTEVCAVCLEEPEQTIRRELLLVKLWTTEAQRSPLMEVCSIYGAQIVDLTPRSMIVELTGKPSKIDAFLELLRGYEIAELCRTGVTAMDRGAAVLEYEWEESHQA